MLYFPVAIIVGLIIIIDGVSLLKSDGKPNKFSMFLSSVEFVWMFISAVALFTLELYGLLLVSPILFISYVLTGFFYGASMYSQIKENEDLLIPKTYTISSMIFASFFILLNALIVFG